EGGGPPRSPELPDSSLIPAGSGAPGQAPRQAARPRERDPLVPARGPFFRPQPPGLFAGTRPRWWDLGGRRGGHGCPGHDGGGWTLERRPGPMSQVSGQCLPHCDAPHGAPSADLGPGRTGNGGEAEPESAHTPSLLPGLEVVTGSTHPVEAALEESSLEEAAPPMPQGNGPGAPQALDSTDLNVPTEAVTRQPQGNPLGCTPLVVNGSSHLSELGGNRRAGNGTLGGPKAHRKLQAHPSLASQGSKKSKGSTRLLRPLHPLLPFVALCNIVLDCATCGSCSSDDSCLCCCCGSGECADCDLPCDLDCGILDACCESADCLEICMECCGLCFSS
ncbi:hypothetical protein MC885_020369, partial [Smutsia gigantea]